MTRPYSPVTSLTCTFCGRKTPDRVNGQNVTFWADKNGWDWFKGYLDEKVVACPKCNGTKAHAAKLKESQQKP